MHRICILVSASDHATSGAGSAGADDQDIKPDRSLQFLWLFRDSQAANRISRDSGLDALRRPGMTGLSIYDSHRQLANATDEVRIEPLWRAH